MKMLCRCTAAAQAALMLLWACPAFAQKHEVGLLLGRFTSVERSSGAAKASLNGGTALQANYGRRVWQGGPVAIYGEVHFLANPQRTVDSASSAATRDVATLFVTPGIRVKFGPGRAVSPYLVAGGGYAAFEQSLTQLNGQPNAAPRTVNRGVFDYGGGVDVKFWRFVGLRGEVRDFYSGSPAFNLPALSGGQHNSVASVGFVIKIK
ncbi:MAG: outer membrane beta-barrel protein [Acidobacteria bacterium]|nr:outer membrane beta-barrel protein [Acidobacteriota bacterium]